MAETPKEKRHRVANEVKEQRRQHVEAVRAQDAKAQKAKGKIGK